MYRFVGRRKFFIKGNKRYRAIMEDKSTGKQHGTNRHFRTAVQADEYGTRVELKINSLLIEQAVRLNEKAKAEGGLIKSTEAFGVPGIIQTDPAPA